MIFDRVGATFFFDGTAYTIGAKVYANQNSDYAGLFGTITEIRTDDDKETENDTPDIYCDFEPPVLPHDIAAMKKRFSSLYRCEKELDDLGLDCIIMAPEMLEVLDSSGIQQTLYLLTEDWAIKDQYGQSCEIYSSELDACHALHNHVSGEKDGGTVFEWRDHDDLIEESSSCSYEAYLDGEYCASHYSVKYESIRVTVSHAVVSDIVTVHEDAQHLADFLELVKNWDELGSPTERQLHNIITDPRLLPAIREALEKREAYWGEYAETIKEVAKKFIKEYASCRDS